MTTLPALRRELAERRRRARRAEARADDLLASLRFQLGQALPGSDRFLARALGVAASGLPPQAALASLLAELGPDLTRSFRHTELTRAPGALFHLAERAALVLGDPRLAELARDAAALSLAEPSPPPPQTGGGASFVDHRIAALQTALAHHEPHEHSVLEGEDRLFLELVGGGGSVERLGTYNTGHNPAGFPRGGCVGVVAPTRGGGLVLTQESPAPRPARTLRGVRGWPFASSARVEVRYDARVCQWSVRGLPGDRGSPQLYRTGDDVPARDLGDVPLTSWSYVPRTAVPIWRRLTLRFRKEAMRLEVGEGREAPPVAATKLLPVWDGPCPRTLLLTTPGVSPQWLRDLDGTEVVLGGLLGGSPNACAFGPHVHVFHALRMRGPPPELSLRRLGTGGFVAALAQGDVPVVLAANRRTEPGASAADWAGEGRRGLRVRACAVQCAVAAGDAGLEVRCVEGDEFELSGSRLLGPGPSRHRVVFLPSSENRFAPGQVAPVTEVTAAGGLAVLRTQFGSMFAPWVCRLRLAQKQPWDVVLTRPLLAFLDQDADFTESSPLRREHDSLRGLFADPARVRYADDRHFMVAGLDGAHHWFENRHRDTSERAFDNGDGEPLYEVRARLRLQDSAMATCLYNGLVLADAGALETFERLRSGDFCPVSAVSSGGFESGGSSFLHARPRLAFRTPSGAEIVAHAVVDDEETVSRLIEARDRRVAARERGTVVEVAYVLPCWFLVGYLLAGVSDLVRSERWSDAGDDTRVSGAGEITCLALMLAMVTWFGTLERYIGVPEAMHPKLTQHLWDIQPVVVDHRVSYFDCARLAAAPLVTVAAMRRSGVVSAAPLAYSAATASLASEAWWAAHTGRYWVYLDFWRLGVMAAGGSLGMVFYDVVNGRHAGAFETWETLSVFETRETWPRRVVERSKHHQTCHVPARTSREALVLAEGDGRFAVVQSFKAAWRPVPGSRKMETPEVDVKIAHNEAPPTPAPFWSARAQGAHLCRGVCAWSEAAGGWRSLDREIFESEARQLFLDYYQECERQGMVGNWVGYGFDTDRHNLAELRTKFGQGERIEALQREHGSALNRFLAESVGRPTDFWFALAFAGDRLGLVGSEAVKWLAKGQTPDPMPPYQQFKEEAARHALGSVAEQIQRYDAHGIGSAFFVVRVVMPVVYALITQRETFRSAGARRRAYRDRIEQRRGMTLR